MRIINRTNSTILCSCKEGEFRIASMEYVDVDSDGDICLCHPYSSYVSDTDRNSVILKVLSLIDDPFHFRKEYHIVIDSEISVGKVDNSHPLVVQDGRICCNYKNEVYYDYYILKCNNKALIPDRVSVPQTDELISGYEKYSRKYYIWHTIWDILIEPLIFEAIGFYLIYRLFAVWFGHYVWFVVAFLIGISLLLEIVLLFRRLNCKKTHISKYFTGENIMENCY